MGERKVRENEIVAWAMTDARCTDEAVGELLGDYLFNALPPEKQGVFEEHLDECIACFTAATNWANLESTARGSTEKTGGADEAVDKARSFKAGS